MVASGGGTDGPPRYLLPRPHSPSLDRGYCAPDQWRTEVVDDRTGRGPALGVCEGRIDHLDCRSRGQEAGAAPKSEPGAATIPDRMGCGDRVDHAPAEPLGCDPDRTPLRTRRLRRRRKDRPLHPPRQIGRASCRVRVYDLELEISLSRTTYSQYFNLSSV